jgi:hypothetical protein
MKKRKKYFPIIVIVMCAVVSLTFIIAFLSSPLHWPKGLNKRYVLWITPVGTSWEEVIQIAEDKNWEIRRTWDDVGYSMLTGSPRVATKYITDNYGYDSVIGVKSMEIFIGTYRFGSIGVFFGFDEDDKLLDVDVIKHVSMR